HQRRKQRKSPAGNIAPDRIQRPNQLPDRDARFHPQIPIPRKLRLGHPSNILGGVLHGHQKSAIHPAFRRNHLFFRDPQAGPRNIRPIQLPGPFNHRPIAAPLHIRNNPRCNHVRFPVVRLPQLQQPGLRLRSEFQDAHHSTILFKGYSTIPCAFAAFNRGKICRTTDSSIIVFTATQSASLNEEIVGFFNAGSAAKTACRFSRRTFSISPTRVVAAIAPCSISTMFSAFSRFAGSSADLRFIIKTVADSSTVSSTRSRFARKDDPVSVTSTMASASSGTFTSVSPHENSTRAFTPCLARYFSVMPTTSVAITLPSKSFGLRIAESS